MNINMESGISNVYLDHLLGPDPSYIGTFPCDQIPEKIYRSMYSIIINLSPHNMPGTHFVSIHINHDTHTCIYFDSLGFKCSNKHILSHLSHQQCHIIHYNKKQIQHWLSDFCGFYCAAFVNSCARDISFPSFINLFHSKGSWDNDDIVIRYLEQYMPQLIAT